MIINNSTRIISYNTLSSGNTYNSTLGAGATYTGTAENILPYPSVTIACKSTQSGTLYAEFSDDGTTWQSSLSFTLAANTNEVHRITTTRSYFRVRITNGATPATVTLSVIYGAQTALNSPLNSTVQPDADSTITRSVLMGQTDSGAFKFVPVDINGHLETAIHSPTLPFGSVHTESLTPVFQGDAVYQANPYIITTTTSGTGTVTQADASFTIETGVGLGAFAVLQSNKRLRYRAGQGVVGKFTAKWSSPVASSIVVAGLGHAEDGVYFGYNGTQFGILYVNRGVREIQTLTITTGATGAGNVTVTLNGTAFVIALTAVGAGNQYMTAWEISRTTFPGWDAQQSGNTVVFLANSAGNRTGAFTYAAGATGSAANFTETRTGATSSDTWIPQTEWNGDRMLYSTDPDNSPSGVTLNPQNGNVFQIGVQYLGYGGITFYIEVAKPGNNPTFVPVHSILYPNNNAKSSFANPSFPLTIAAYSAGSTTNVSIQTASYAGFIEGQKVLHGPRLTYTNSSAAVDAAAFYSILAVRNSFTYTNKANQSVINILSITAALKHNFPASIYLVLNPTFTTQQNFSQYSTSSCSLYSSTFSTVTWADNAQLIWTGNLGDTGELDHHFGNGTYSAEELTIQPGDIVAIVARTSSGTASSIRISLNTREDQ